MWLSDCTITVHHKKKKTSSNFFFLGNRRGNLNLTAYSKSSIEEWQELCKSTRLKRKKVGRSEGSADQMLTCIDDNPVPPLMPFYAGEQHPISPLLLLFRLFSHGRAAISVDRLVNQRRPKTAKFSINTFSSWCDTNEHLNQQYTIRTLKAMSGIICEVSDDEWSSGRIRPLRRRSIGADCNKKKGNGR